MSLTREEVKEAKGLREAIEVFECFNTKDLAREAFLRNKANKKQFKRIFGQQSCYYPSDCNCDYCS